MRWTRETVRIRIRDLPILRTVPSAYALRYQPSPDWQQDKNVRKGLPTRAEIRSRSTMSTGRECDESVRFNPCPYSGDAHSITVSCSGSSRPMISRI